MESNGAFLQEFASRGARTPLRSNFECEERAEDSRGRSVVNSGVERLMPRRRASVLIDDTIEHCLVLIGAG